MNFQFFVVNTEENHSFLVNADSTENAFALIQEYGYTPLSIDAHYFEHDSVVDIENLLM